MAFIEPRSTARITAIKFGLLSPDMIRKMSVTAIVTADTYDEEGMPIRSGLMDRRLGTIEPGMRCETCGNLTGQCPGHFGHLELARPVIHPEFAKRIYMLLKATCRHCGRILLSEEEIEKELKKREKLEKIWFQFRYKHADRVAKKAAKNNECPYCRTKQYKIRFEKPYTFYEEREEGTAIKLTPSEIRERLERIPDKDLILLGIDPEYARPEWTVFTVLPVPPITVRPSITLETGIRSEDDLTHKLGDIIRVNQRLKENIEAGAPSLIIDDMWELLQYHIATYFNNELPGIPPAKHKSGRPLRTLAQRLKGKEGRFRGSLAGKRVDFSARTVISPDPNLSINEVGVPEEVAKILIIPEKVTEWNIEELRELVRNGPYKHPGANYIVRPDGARVDLRYVRDLDALAETLAPGYIVERHLKDGDIVLFNRQPSLHRMSIMAHKVKVLPYKTFRLNLLVCPPYNADFDGDEMNLHVPQNEEARAEAKILMLVQEQILSPRYGGPIIGGLHDYITGGYMVTKKDTLLTREKVTLLLYSSGLCKELPEPAILKPKELWTGKQIVSIFLPSDLNFRSRCSICEKCDMCLYDDCPYDAYLFIKNGEIVSGVFDKLSIGAQRSETLLHVLVKKYGTDKAREIMDTMFKVFIFYLDMNGFSMSLDNLDLPENAKKEIKEILSKVEGEVAELIKKARRGELQPKPGMTLRESLENEILNVLERVREEAGRIASKYLGLNNSAVLMAKTGARANILNITQMTACLGQQSIRGKRIYRGYTDRPLPHFRKGDIGAKARGFVYSNFKDGLSPTEFFFHAMAGREGLVDTAVRTAQSGYMYRRLANALQDLYVAYDGSVRSAEGSIIQLRYGEDGVDPTKSYHGQPINFDLILQKFRKR